MTGQISMFYLFIIELTKLFLSDLMNLNSFNGNDDTVFFKSVIELLLNRSHKNSH